MKLKLTAWFLVLGVFGLAQEHVSSFTSMTFTYNFHPKFFLYGEGQLRGIEDYSYPDYYEIKGGLGYNISKNHKPFIGIGRYAAYSDHDLAKEEFRIWLQDVYNLRAGVVKFENRVRAERSWFHDPNTDENSARTRFRYRLNISVPLNNTKVEPGTIFANAYEEVFFVAPMKPTFARNRLYGGFGYQIDDTFGIASGYLWQREFGENKNRNFHFIYLALNISIDHVDKEKTYNFPGAD